MSKSLTLDVLREELAQFSKDLRAQLDQTLQQHLKLQNGVNAAEAPKPGSIEELQQLSCSWSLLFTFSLNVRRRALDFGPRPISLA